MTPLACILEDTADAILSFVVRSAPEPVESSLPEEIDLDKYRFRLWFPYGTACAVKLRLISLIMGTQYRFMPQLSTISCNLSQMFKALADCRNWMPRELVCGDSWSKTLRFP